MINKIVEAIGLALNAEFGSDINIYTEKVEQGLQKPCFFIACVNQARQLWRGRMYRRENQFCLQYFPADIGRVREECNAVAERLFSCLEFLPVGAKKLRGCKMHYEIIDNTLHFFVNYDFLAEQAQDTPAMTELAEQVGVRE